jgi:hypothetical protein
MGAAMSEKRFAIIHFTDGSKMKLEFPKQEGDEANLANRILKLLDSPCIMIEADGSMITIPMSSIKYIQSHPCPRVLPDLAIKGASLVD